MPPRPRRSSPRRPAWSSGTPRDEGPNLRAVAGRDVVVASHPEPDAAEPGALFLWAVGDLLRLAAANAAALAAALVAERGAR